MKKNFVLVVLALLLFSTAYAERTIWYVHPDSALNTIQAGLDSCADNDIVLVGPGTYVENIVWPNTQGIHLISELGPDTTIIDGDSAGSVLTIDNGIDTSTTIIGFTIRDGFADNGSGILCSNHSAPRICGNIITSNDGGASIACIDSSSPFISDNTIQSNTAGGIMCNYYSSPIITDNIITNNVVWFGLGGGILCMESSPTITGNTISYNQCLPVKNINMLVDYSRKVTNSIDFKRPGPSGGGICLLASAPLIDGNSIIGNSGVWGGGIFCVGSSPTIRSTTISENIACHGGGGIYISEDSLLFIKNIVTANVAAFGGGICCDYALSLIIDSCTISNNNRDGIYCNHVASVINYNNITNNIGYGMRNDWSGIIVNAEYNWWGDASGPYHATANPGGLGDTVSDYVDFIPWDTVPYPWGIEEYEPSQPITTLLQISPNPFRVRVDITFSIGQSAKSIELRIYDATGRMVKDFKHVINQQIFWNGTDDLNRKLPSGVYFLKFQAGDYSATEKLLLIR